MNITLNKSAETDPMIKITLEESDYQPKVEEKIKEYSRKINIKGFRQGKVPTGVIKRMYGKSILVDQVDHLVSDSLTKYIKDNQLVVLGNPIPNVEKEKIIDWDNQKNFEFEFLIGYVEDYDVNLSSELTVSAYKIEVDKKTVDNAIENVKKQCSTKLNLEVSEDDDMVFVDGEIKNEQKRKCSIQISKIKVEQKNKFIGVKKGDEIKFQIEEITDDSTLLFDLTGKNEVDAKLEKGQYVFEVTDVFKMNLADLNQDTFDKVFGKDVVKNVDEFNNKIKETISDNYSRETEHFLDFEIKNKISDVIPIKMPEAFLRKSIKSNDNKSVEGEISDDKFGEYKKSIKWDLITNKIAEKNNIQVEPDEITESAKKGLMAQMGNVNSEQFDDKAVNEIVKNYLLGPDGKRDNYMNIYKDLRNKKIINFIKEKISISEKKVSMEEFKSMVDAQNSLVENN